MKAPRGERIGRARLILHFNSVRKGRRFLGSPFAEFFRAIPESARRGYTYWSMSNGVEFWCNIPSPDEIEGDRLVEYYRFPYTLSEIRSIAFRRSFGTGKAERKCDVDALYALFPMQGLIATLGPESLLVVAENPVVIPWTKD